MLKPNPAFIATDLGHELILLDPTTNRAFGLNVTGREIWLALPQPDVAGIACVLAERFAVSAERAGADAAALLDQMLAAGVVLDDGDPEG